MFPRGLVVPLAVGADLAAASVALLLVALLRYDWSHLAGAAGAPAGIGVAALGAMLWVGAMSALAGYRPGVLISGVEQLARVVPAVVVAWLAMHFAGFWLKLTVPFESRLVTGLWLPMALLLAAVLRMGVVRPAARSAFVRLSRGPLLFVGEPGGLPRLIRALGWPGVRTRHVDARSLAHLSPADVAWMVERRGYGKVVLAANGAALSRTFDIAFACLDAGSMVTVVLDGATGRDRGLPGPGVQVSQLRLRPLGGRIEALLKRAIDLVGASFGLVLLSPLFLAIAIVVKASSRGPVFHVQRRMGRRGRPFVMYKFRTMKDGNDSRRYRAYINRFIREGMHAGVTADGSKLYKPPNDPRVTPLGSWLRRLSLDELPQLWNVLRGEMSLVGPRPCLPWEWDLYEPWQRRRLDVLPGCTGLWQVRARSRVPFLEMVLLDLQYAHHATLCTDLRLILETFPVMLQGRGAC